MGNKRRMEKISKVYGYVRISSNKQEVDAQNLAIMKYCRKNKIVIDDMIEIEASSRKTTKQRRIDELLEKIKSYDTLICSELSRIGRSVGQNVTIIDSLIEKKIRLIFIKENIDIPPNGEKDADTILRTGMFSLFAELERKFISERTKEGLRAAKEKNKNLKFGRPEGRGKSRLDEHEEEIKELLKLGLPKTKIAKKYNCSVQNLYNWLNWLKKEKKK